MNKPIKLLILLASILFLLISIFYKRSYFDPNINCTGDIYSSLGKDIFDGSMRYTVSRNEGFVKLVGQLKSKEITNNTVSRVVYFTLKRQGNQFLMHDTHIEKSKTDNVLDLDLDKALPSFYVYEKRNFSVSIVKSKNGMIFYTSNLPSLYCKNI